MNFFIGKVFQVLYFPSNAAVKTENLEERFLRSFFSNFALPVIGNYDPFSLQISYRNETSFKKLTEFSNYGKFICNIFNWDTVKGLLELKFSLVCGFKMMGCSRVSSICVGILRLLLVKCRQGLSNSIKNPHCFVSVSFYV